MRFDSAEPKGTAPAAEADPQSADRSSQPCGTYGPYVLLECIGRGGMAEVFRARLERGAFRKDVALKRVLPHLASEQRFRARFLGEARTAAELQHPNIVQVFDYGEDAGMPYIVMELIDGVDLWQLFSHSQLRNEPLPVEASLFLVAEAARGLGYAHAFAREGRPVGLVHRDVSPQNILVSKQGEVKLADFGIAKATQVLGTGVAGLAGDNAVVGKFRYMAPEQLTARLPAHPRSDLFSLGVVLHELLTTAPRVPPNLDAVLTKCIARDMRERFATGEDMAAALDRIITEVAPGFGRPALGALVSKSRRGPIAVVTEPEDSIPTPVFAESPKLFASPPPSRPVATFFRRLSIPLGIAVVLVVTAAVYFLNGLSSQAAPP